MKLPPKPKGADGIVIKLKDGKHPIFFVVDQLLEIDKKIIEEHGITAEVMRNTRHGRLIGIYNEIYRNFNNQPDKEYLNNAFETFITYVFFAGCLSGKDSIEEIKWVKSTDEEEKKESFSG